MFSRFILTVHFSLHFGPLVNVCFTAPFGLFCERMCYPSHTVFCQAQPPWQLTGITWSLLPLTDNIQLMHSFDVNIRICQPEKVMSTEAKPRWTSLSRVD